MAPIAVPSMAMPRALPLFFTNHLPVIMATMVVPVNDSPTPITAAHRYRCHLF